LAWGADAPAIGSPGTRLKTVLLLQGPQVAFLWTHDRVPPHGLNDVRAVRDQDRFGRLLSVTLLPSLPYSVLLALSMLYPGRPFPHWLITSLWIAYSALLLGQLRTW
jgi:hypothetical protein